MTPSTATAPGGGRAGPALTEQDRRAAAVESDDDPRMPTKTLRVRGSILRRRPVPRRSRSAPVLPGA